MKMGLNPVLFVSCAVFCSSFLSQCERIAINYITLAICQKEDAVEY